MMRNIPRFVLIIALLLAAPASAAESLGDFILHHVTDSDSWHFLGMTIHFPQFQVAGINLGISLHIAMIILAFFLLLIFLKIASRRRGLVPAGGFAHAIEAVVIYVRDEILVPNMGRKDAEKWLPFFLTLFLFVLTVNLLGLIPGMSTASANINFTGTLSVTILIIYMVAGMLRNGSIHYFTNLVPKGIPVFVLPIIAPIEFLGLFTRAFALAIRLFANMSGGHIIIFSLLGLIAVFKSFLFVPIFLGFTLFIYIIEVLVAFLQAYIFTLLASLFVGLALHQEH